MSVPGFLSSSASYFYSQLVLVTDVSAIIAEFREAALGGLSTPWTEPSSGIFRSPVDSSGQFFEIALTALSATRLRIDVIDMYALTISSRAVDVADGGNPVQIFTGKYHAFINSDRTVPEFGGGAVLDKTPETMLLSGYRTIGCGARTIGGTLSNPDWTYWFIRSASTAQELQCADFQTFLNRGHVTRSVAGTNIFRPVLIRTTVSAQESWVGRIHQIIKSDDSQPYGAEVTVPIDVSSTGVFKVIGRPAAYGIRLAVRIA